MNLPAEIQARRDAEDKAAQLGLARAALNQKMAENTGAIKKLLADAIAAGVTMEALARLTGVSRQTLHQWHNETGMPGSPTTLGA